MKEVTDHYKKIKDIFKALLGKKENHLNESGKGYGINKIMAELDSVVS